MRFDQPWDRCTLCFKAVPGEARKAIWRLNACLAPRLQCRYMLDSSKRGCGHSWGEHKATQTVAARPAAFSRREHSALNGGRVSPTNAPVSNSGNSSPCNSPRRANARREGGRERRGPGTEFTSESWRCAAHEWRRRTQRRQRDLPVHAVCMPSLPRNAHTRHNDAVLAQSHPFSSDHG